MVLGYDFLFSDSITCLILLFLSLIKTEKTQSNRYKIKNSTAQGISCTIASLMYLSHLITEMKKRTQKWNRFFLFLWDSGQLLPVFRCVKNSETSNIKGKDTHLAFSRCLFPSVVSGVSSILIPKQWKSLEPYTSCAQSHLLYVSLSGDCWYLCILLVSVLEFRVSSSLISRWSQTRSC